MASRQGALHQDSTSRSKRGPLAGARTAIIVVAYHGQRWIPDCVASLSESMERREHLCLVDNSGNGDAIPQSVENCDYTILKTPEPMGFAPANNFALERLSKPYEFICLLNQDTLCRPGWLERCLEVMDANPDIGMISPVHHSFGWADLNPNFRSCAEGSAPLMADLTHEVPRSDHHPVSYVPAAAVVVRSSVLWQTGPFDSVFGSYYEDYDLCRRVRAAGYSVAVCPQAHIAHYDSVTDESLRDRRTRRKHMLILRNRAVLRIRDCKGSRLLEWLRVMGIAMPRQLILTLLRRPGHKAVRSILGATGSLIALAPRLVNTTLDQRLWQSQLHQFRERFSVTLSDSAAEKRRLESQTKAAPCD
jgi:N-acetylglucosaminyl-diphospho-decaprenol L-rhamnosyltransferase